MRLFDKDGKPENEGKPGSGGMIERMLMDFVQNNPGLRDAITQFQQGVLGIAQQGQRVEANTVRIITLLEEVNTKLTALQLNGRTPLIALEGKGMVSDGTRCALCGSTAGCDCYSAEQLSGSGTGSGDGGSSGDDCSSRVD